MSEIKMNPAFGQEVANAMAVRNASPQFVNSLRAELLTQASRSRRRPAARQLAWGIPLAVVMLMLLTTVLIGPQKVWAAIQRMFGYVPEVGYVNTEGQVLALSEPVSVERDGISVTVEQVVADAERTIVIYKTQGLSVHDANSQGEGALTGSLEILRLPDGSEISGTSGEMTGWGAGYRSRLIFKPLPTDADTFTLVIPRLQTMPAGVAPENWEIEVKLEPAPADFDALPVMELTLPAEATQTSTDETAAPLEEPEVLFTLERVVELEDGFLLEGLAQWNGAQPVSLFSTDIIQIVDAEGNHIPTEYASPDEVYAVHTNTQTSWAVRTYTKNRPGPWTLVLPKVWYERTIEGEFTVELGDSSAVGQVWTLNQPVNAGEMQLILDDVTLQEGSWANYRLNFNFSGAENLMGLTIRDPEKEPIESTGGGGGGGGSEEPGKISAYIYYNNPPTGTRTIQLVSMMVVQSGDWEINWQPPASSEEVEPQPEGTEQDTCTPTDWQALLQESITLPEEVGGNLLLQTHSGERLPDVVLTNLQDTAQTQTYGIGAWISLSPDGSKIAVPQDDGIAVYNAASGEGTTIPNTAGAGYPVWSADGEQIAFSSWEDAAIYTIRLDGTQRTQVYQGDDVIYLSDWSSDGERLIYLGFGDGGMAINAINLADGTVEVLIQTAENKPISRPRLSPDGKWLLYSDSLSDNPGRGVFLARVDGSETKLLVTAVNPDQVTFQPGAWSPDGQWVAVNVYDYTVYTDNPVPALISTATCEVIPLVNFSGQVVGWGQ